MRLFNRQVVLEINDQAYKDLRVDFKIEKTIKSDPNSAEIEVYNLSGDKSALVEAEDRKARIRLLAGYSTPRLLFEGNPVQGGVKLKQDGPDRILKIEAEDGLVEYQSARLQKSYSSEKKLSDIVSEVAGEMGLPEGTIKVPGNARLTQGRALSGPARDILRRLADSVGADFSIQDGTIQFLPEDETSEKQAVKFSAENGNLIGRPSKTDEGLEIKGLLDGSVNPGDRYVVKSEEFEGVYKAKTVTFTGSKFSDKFYITIVGTEA